eukprot:6887984-Pyramimonas_sp.AAC.1
MCIRDRVPCERSRWGLRRSSLRGHETCDWVCRNGRGGAMRTLPLGPHVERTPYEAKKRRA